jgi:hypothetical protein
MKTCHDSVVERVAQHFETIGFLAEDRILSQMIQSGDVFCSYHFEADADTLRRLSEILTADRYLWADFRHAVEAHREARHWTALVEHVFEIGKLEGKLRFLEQGLSCLCPIERRALASQLNSIDGEMAVCRDLADRRNLAARVNRTAESPLIDGLTVRGLTYVFGEDPGLWQAFRAIVDGRDDAACNGRDGSRAHPSSDDTCEDIA